ncbi:MAG: hypothetical protein JST01_17815 [Cyanobacteria bacterium SZAS TMP-1]|nr:hypothetical protein [Cyanobacteria bacterium SZAS TMP-1]
MDKKEPVGAREMNEKNDNERPEELKKTLSGEPEKGSEDALVGEVSDDSSDNLRVPGTPGEMIPGFLDIKTSPAQGPRDLPVFGSNRKYIAYTVKLPAEQLAALQSIWLELKRLYGSNSPDKSGMIQLAVQDWLKRWDGPEKSKLLNELLEIRQDTRKRQYKKN